MVYLDFYEPKEVRRKIEQETVVALLGQYKDGASSDDESQNKEGEVEFVEERK